MDRSKVLTGDWLAFTAATPEATARERFLEKHGRAPAAVIHDRGLILVGPVDDPQDGPEMPAVVIHERSLLLVGPLDAPRSESARQLRQGRLPGMGT